jgi:hypothetical protein
MAYYNLSDMKIGDNPDLLLFDGNIKKIQNVIRDFFDYQYEVLGLSPKTVHAYYSALKIFYETKELH